MIPVLCCRCGQRGKIASIPADLACFACGSSDVDLDDKTASSFGTPGDPTQYGVGGDHCPHCGADWKQPHDGGCLRNTDPGMAIELEAVGELALEVANNAWKAANPGPHTCPSCSGSGKEYSGGACRNCGGKGSWTYGPGGKRASIFDPSMPAGLLPNDQPEMGLLKDREVTQEVLHCSSCLTDFKARVGETIPACPSCGSTATSAAGTRTSRKQAVYVPHKWVSSDGYSACIVCGIPEEEAIPFNGPMVGCEGSDYSAKDVPYHDPMDEPISQYARKTANPHGSADATGDTFHGIQDRVDDVYCPNCGTEGGEYDGTSCGNCGYQREKKTAACSTCQHASHKGECPQCGHEGAKVECPGCGFRAPVGATSCPKCSAKMGSLQYAVVNDRGEVQSLHATLAEAQRVHAALTRRMVECPTCQGTGVETECANDGSHGCSHVNDTEYTCQTCDGEGEWDPGSDTAFDKDGSRKTADYGYIRQQMSTLSGSQVALSYSTDLGMRRDTGTLTFDGHGATLLTSHGAISIDPVMVVGIEAYGSDIPSPTNPGPLPAGRAPNLADYLLSGVTPAGVWSKKVAVAAITRGILATNPGMARQAAHDLAVKTVKRYPKVAAEGDVATKDSVCTQSGTRIHSEGSDGKCKFCKARLTQPDKD